MWGRHAAAALAAVLLTAGCRAGDRTPPPTEKAVARRPLTEVLAAHTPRLMALAGVVGTCEGALDDGAPCFVIMVAALTPALRDSLPQTLEGWPVRVDETGEIRPMGGGAR
jgi:hypothetical protein